MGIGLQLCLLKHGKKKIDLEIFTSQYGQKSDSAYFFGKTQSTATLRPLFKGFPKGSFFCIKKQSCRFLFALQL